MMLRLTELNSAKNTPTNLKFKIKYHISASSTAVKGCTDMPQGGDSVVAEVVV